MDAATIQSRLLIEIRAEKGKSLFTGDSAMDLAHEVLGAVQRMVGEGSPAPTTWREPVRACAA